MIPAPVLARAMLRQVEDDAFELFMPYSAGDLARHRATNVVPMIEMMAGWYERTGGAT